jgi:aminoglycoside phosphotransferase family enzyme/predicted kinase
LIQALLHPGAYPHPVETVALAETHISWVLLTGSFAYKIKKPVKLDFLDFSTLAMRQQACEDELRLNRHFAPQLYLDVTPISGTPTLPRVADRSQPIEYAVRMQQFPADARLDRVLARGEFDPATCDRLARMVAVIHRDASVATAESRFGDPGTVEKQVGDVVQLAVDQTRGAALEETVDRIANWTTTEFARLIPLIERRKAAGRVRRCHGDLHSENIVILDGEPVAFDCLEFRDDLRWIDCASDLAFLTMDLTERGFPHFSNRLLVAWLDETDDIESLHVMRYYQVYRALVRAVVATLRARQADAGPSNILERAQEYLQLAFAYTRPPTPAVIITHGVSGAGKSTATQQLVERFGVIRLRSDIERTRLDVGPSPSPGDEVSTGRYAPAARQAVYQAMLQKAETVLDAGYRVIIDATFLRRADRDAFRRLAHERHVPFLILAFDADPATLRQRIENRQRAGGDASEATAAVLERQLAEREPLAEGELPYVRRVAADALTAFHL